MLFLDAGQQIIRAALLPAYIGSCCMKPGAYQSISVAEIEGSKQTDAKRERDTHTHPPSERGLRNDRAIVSLIHS